MRTLWATFFHSAVFSKGGKRHLHVIEERHPFQVETASAEDAPLAFEMIRRKPKSEDLETVSWRVFDGKLYRRLISPLGTAEGSVDTFERLAKTAQHVTSWRDYPFLRGYAADASWTGTLDETRAGSRYGRPVEDDRDEALRHAAIRAAELVVIDNQLYRAVSPPDWRSGNAIRPLPAFMTPEPVWRVSACRSGEVCAVEIEPVVAGVDDPRYLQCLFRWDKLDQAKDFAGELAKEIEAGRIDGVDIVEPTAVVERHGEIRDHGLWTPSFDDVGFSLRDSARTVMEGVAQVRIEHLPRGFLRHLAALDRVRDPDAEPADIEAARTALRELSGISDEMVHAGQAPWQLNQAAADVQLERMRVETARPEADDADLMAMGAAGL